jgi:hypothetical protein
MLARTAHESAPVIATVNRRKDNSNMSTLRLTSAHAGAYFQIQCASCGSDTQVDYLGRDPACPRFRSTCAACPGRPSVVWKLRATLTTGFPLIPELFSSALRS